MIDWMRLVAVIQMLETGSCADPAHARNGDCWGWLQISSGVVADYNKRHAAKFTHERVAESLQLSRLVATDHLIRFDKTPGHTLSVADALGIWRAGYGAWLNHALTKEQKDYVERGENLYNAERGIRKGR